MSRDLTITQSKLLKFRSIHYLVHIIWSILFGPYYLVHITWSILLGPYYLVHIIWSILFGPYYLVHITWSILLGPYYLVHIIWSILLGPYYLVHITRSILFGSVAFLTKPYNCKHSSSIFVISFLVEQFHFLITWFFSLRRVSIQIPN